MTSTGLVNKNRQQKVGIRIIPTFCKTVPSSNKGNTWYAKGSTIKACNKYTFMVREPYGVIQVKPFGKSLNT